MNDRIVEMKHTRSALIQAFSMHLPVVAHHAHYFVYLAIQARQQDLDVNIHPTKSEVSYVYSTELSGHIYHELSKKLEIQDAFTPSSSLPHKTNTSTHPQVVELVATEEEQRQATSVYRNSGL